MKVVTTIKDLQAQLAAARNEGKSIGLVPTMGALHAGHASLVRRSVADNDVTVVSIFLNPTQFNDKNDLARYPRTLDKDCELLEACGAQLAFAPSVEEAYPEPDTRHFSYPPTDAVMEGARRPGHFNGVCQIVSKLFSWVEPTRAYFGEKDFQQIAVIRRMVEDLGFGLDIVPCPVVREADGLAMSSRNTLLAPEERVIAPLIYAALKASQEFAKSHSVTATIQYVVNRINAVDGLDVDHIGIRDYYFEADYEQRTHYYEYFMINDNYEDVTTDADYEDSNPVKQKFSECGVKTYTHDDIEALLNARAADIGYKR